MVRYLLSQPYDIVRKDFACKLKIDLYNADIERNGERKMEMIVGQVAKVEYATGEKFIGEIVKVRTMPEQIEVFGVGPTGVLQNRVLFTVHDETVGYRSLYLDKCARIEVLSLQTL